MKKIIIILSITFALFGVNVVYANDYGLGKTAHEAGLDNAISGDKTVAGMVGNVIGQALTLVGVLFLLLMIYGGVIWMIARGNEQQTDKALNTIKAAIIGLAIVVASYAITTFVFNAISGNATTEVSPTSSASSGCCVYPLDDGGERYIWVEGANCVTACVNDAEANSLLCESEAESIPITASMTGEIDCEELNS
ncbi:MAG: hypothetical protein A2469_03340 [Candidatus Magasanikbacteria bacterium RIFOXYC2_FULL_40_16]|uniref:Uncharacterized protein n=2 Tax=Candidatus Magasanikiibacteriota TaxID=1752731 RepID=A0A1F6NGB7_9BACT|nr:MAG: hypothetical protein A2373_04220 [Candidatus Magasanikbacteria bacterium RIFOXYB1_FULL_40_15]OGH89844.1 MAG: hypothetical protein A2469_03340 [Candidatus Magasanikbacteria bacterium RIFOXYC2_FULL_40_16]